jgi:hypothetical protein
MNTPYKKGGVEATGNNLDRSNYSNEPRAYGPVPNINNVAAGKVACTYEGANP